MFDYTALQIRLDDPLIVEWALAIWEGLQKTHPATAAAFEKAVFTESVVRKILETGDHEFVSTLFSIAPAETFSAHLPLIIRRWPSWENSTAEWSAQVMAKLDPAAAAEKFREFLDSDPGFSDESKSYGVILALSRMAPAAERDLPARLLEAYLQMQDGWMFNRLFPAMFALAFLKDFPGALRILERLPLFAEKGWDFENMFRAAYAELTCRLPYFQLAQYIMWKGTRQTFSRLARLFVPQAPLQELDALCACRKIPAMVKTLDRLREQGKIAGTVIELAGKLKKLEAGFREKEQKVCLRALLVGYLAWQYALPQPDWSAGELQELIEYAASDLRPLPGLYALAKRLQEFERNQVIEKLLLRFSKEWKTFGGPNLAEVMGRLGYPEFASALLTSLDADSDYLCDDAMYALSKLGEPAEKLICENWQSLSESQQLYSFGALGRCGGERTIQLLLAIFPEIKGGDLEPWCSAALWAPDRRLLEILVPELPRQQFLIDETFLTLCSLLDYPYPGLKQVRARLEQIEKEDREEHWATMEGSRQARAYLRLPLNCPQCKEINEYRVHRVIVDASNQKEKPIIGEELRCLSCGELAELEMADPGWLMLTAELFRYTAAMERHEEYEGPLKIIDACTADGRIMSLRQSIQHYKEKISRRPDSIVDLISLGNCYMKVNYFIRAKEQFSKAFALNPAYVEAALQLSFLLKEEGHFLEAFDTLERALAFQPEWKFCRLREVTIPEFYEAFYEQYNNLAGNLGLKKRPPIQPDLAEGSAEISNKKIGRNDPCPCGSGKKYKKCCLGKKTEQ